MKNFITTGCSFTAGTIPLPHDNKNAWKNKGSVWPHFCFAEMNPAQDQFINLALPGGGNIAAFTNLIYILENNQQTFRPDNTLIGINITGMHRYDLINDSINNDQINKNLCCIDTNGIQHISDTLGFGWVTGQHFGNQKIDILSAVTIVQSLAYLELHKFNYFFMLMNNAIYDYSPEWFKHALNKRKSNWITFNEYIGMFEFVEQLKQTTNDGHPSTDGHKSIGRVVLDFINTKHKNYLNHYAE